MTLIIPDSRSPLEDMRWVAWRNDNSTVCPAGGLIRVTGSVQKGRLLVRTGDKPNADSQAGLYVNSHFPVQPGGYGRMTHESPCMVRYTGSAPTNGQVWGAASGSWYLTTGKRGWLIDGVANTTRTIVPAQRVSSDVSSGSSTPTATPVPCYAVRNNGSQSATKNTTSTVTLDTQIHRYPDDSTNFTLSGSEVTVVQRKVVSLKWGIHFTAISSDIAGAVWLEDDGTLIKGTKVTYSVGPGALGHISGSLDHVVSAANAEIRMRISETLNGENVTIYGDDSNGYSRLDIDVIRDP